MVIQVYAPTSNAEEGEVEKFYEDLQDLLELTPKKEFPLIIGDWNAKVGSQETPGSNGQIWPWSQNKAGQRLIEFYQENTNTLFQQHIANTLFQQHKRRLYTWTSPDDNTEIRLIILFIAKDGEQDRELTVAQIMNSLLPNSD